jgi:hypothetical protein
MEEVQGRQRTRGHRFILRGVADGNGSEVDRG